METGPNPERTRATPVAFMRRYHADVRELLRFGVVGLLNTGTGLFVIWTLLVLHVGPYLANAAGYGAGIVISFALNRNWTFKRTGPTRPYEVVRFVLAFAMAYAANLAVVTALLRVDVSPYLAQLAGLPIYTGVFYLLSKLFVFAETKSVTLDQAS